MIIASIISVIPSVNAQNWQTVKVFNGSGTVDQNTSTFTITSSHWRIRWSFNPYPQYPSLTLFSFFTYHQGESLATVDQVMIFGGTPTNGLENVDQGSGNYYFRINVANTAGYTIIVEQDTISFDSGIGMEIGLALIIIVAVIVVGLWILNKQKKKRHYLRNPLYL
jgi:hypothetical protein